MSVRDIKQNSRKYQKLMEYSQMNKLKNNMTPPESSGKDGPKWATKLNKAPILMKNTKMYSTACLQNKDNSSKNKHKPDSEDSE